ncbi:MAG: hypothetical protein ACKOPN_01920, partial [Prochlorococcaceae cyanobacterium]
LRLNGHHLALEEEPERPLAVRYRHQRLYPCLHPAQPPQLPLVLELVTAAGGQRFQLGEGDPAFRPMGPSETPLPQAKGDAGAGRHHPCDVTVDLRLLEGALTS